MQEVVRRFILEYNRSVGATVLLTSHYMGDVTALCERVMVIGGGRLLYDGGIAELVDRHSPRKRIKLQLAEGGSAEAIRARLAREPAVTNVMLDDYPVALFEVPREQVSAVSAKLLADFPVLDLTIEDPSMETVIGQAFAQTDGAGGSAGALRKENRQEERETSEVGRE